MSIDKLLSEVDSYLSSRVVSYPSTEGEIACSNALDAVVKARKLIATPAAVVRAAPALMRQAVASVAYDDDGVIRLNWMRPERVQAGTLLYCATEPGGDKQGGT